MPNDFRPAKDYQYAHLYFVYFTKPDLSHKSWLVCDGTRVHPRGFLICDTAIKGVPIQLLGIIAESQGSRVLTGDIGNAFIQDNTAKKVYTCVGPKFGEHPGQIALIVKALYGLTTSAEKFCTMLADFLRQPILYHQGMTEMCGCVYRKTKVVTLISALMCMILK